MSATLLFFKTSYSYGSSMCPASTHVIVAAKYIFHCICCPCPYGIFISNSKNRNIIAL